MNVHDFSVRTAEGGSKDLRDYAGEVLLVVNVASKCGLTPQYEGLEALHRDEKDRGLRILGFPCNQFGGQEPGSDEEIQDFCAANYSVTFPVFSKIDVNGADADPLYAYLRAEAPGDLGPNPEAIGTDEIKWNFTKFLVDRDGNVIRRYEPMVTPDELRTDLDAILAG